MESAVRGTTATVTQLTHMSPEELAEARTRDVEEIEELGEQIITAKLCRFESERRALERQRDSRYQALRIIDAEFKRRGLEPQRK